MPVQFTHYLIKNESSVPVRSLLSDKSFTSIAIPLHDAKTKHWALAVLRGGKREIDIYDSKHALRTFIPPFPKLLRWCNNVHHIRTAEDWRSIHFIRERIDARCNLYLAVNASIFMLYHAFLVARKNEHPVQSSLSANSLRVKILQSVKTGVLVDLTEGNDSNQTVCTSSSIGAQKSSLSKQSVSSPSRSESNPQRLSFEPSIPPVDLPSITENENGPYWDPILPVPAVPIIQTVTLMPALKTPPIHQMEIHGCVSAENSPSLSYNMLNTNDQAFSLSSTSVPPLEKIHQQHARKMKQPKKEQGLEPQPATNSTSIDNEARARGIVRQICKHRERELQELQTAKKNQQ